MDHRIKETGMLYEKLMMRAYHLEFPSAPIGADRRIYYLLYYIKIGLDLRQTGYPTQFNTVKAYITTAMENLLRQELHREEKVQLRKLLKELSEVWSESDLEKLLKKALSTTSRLNELVEA